ncbi:hypothetical protein [Nocardia sp. NPDC004860]|uniref:hypothetical protein n=1 Tax=Nocardia sp. NPDC004860 TaxID=3154557 RepID=UPI0033A36E11
MSSRQPIPESPDGNAIHGLVYTFFAYLSIIGFGLLIGSLAWLLDWSATLWSTW